MPGREGAARICSQVNLGLGGFFFHFLLIAMAECGSLYKMHYTNHVTSFFNVYFMIEASHFYQEFNLRHSVSL